MTKQVLFLEFNEINFESVAFYCARGRLPNLQQLIDSTGGWLTTTSEQQHEHLEPWIQWVTAHTGLSLAQHGVFRLGDIVAHDIPQIWERLESLGLKVGAISPMNAKHRLSSPAFFVPDSWTSTEISAPRGLKRLCSAISQAVNDNAQSRLTASSAYALVCGILRYALPYNYAAYAALALGSHRRPWRKAMFLDLLLSDIFVRQVQQTAPQFASLFLNAGAHIQHHYMFCSESYQGPHRNPEWYVPSGLDPVREVYELYDRVLGQVRRAFPRARVMLATALHQEPHAEVTYYWRLKAHGEFLKSINVPFSRIEPRMSRDFVVHCVDYETARIAAERLRQASALDGTNLFDVDNRGCDLFVMLTYPREISPEFRFRIGIEEYAHLAKNVAFVALKNGEHNGVGYFLDTGTSRDSVRSQGAFPLKEVPARIFEAFGLPTTSSTTQNET